MKWEPWGKYAIRTTNYSIAKAINVASPYLKPYTLFKLPNIILGHYTTSQEAKNEAMEHFKTESTLSNREIEQLRLKHQLSGNYSRK